MSLPSVAIYVHLPYCLYKCHYCDFNSYVVADLAEKEKDYTQTLLQEIESVFQQFPPLQVGSVFFGGGTPSLFSADSIEKILEAINSKAHLQPGVEITLEVNPKTIYSGKTKSYIDIGINRFSVGVQSFQDQYLSPLGRLHSGKQALQTLQQIREEGAQNLSLDLMFGFPHQTVEEVLHDLEQAIALQPDHLSFYQLTVEEGTFFAQQVKKKKVNLLEQETEVSMYQNGIQLLEKNQYFQYEVSNFAKEGRQAKHNLSYWNYSDFIGFGAGAASFLNRSFFPRLSPECYGLRWMNPKKPEQYRAQSQTAFPEWTKEKISPSVAQGEFWMMGLRLKQGILREDFEKKFGEKSFFSYQEQIERFVAKGWLEASSGRVFATSQGLLFLNAMISDFLVG